MEHLSHCPICGSADYQHKHTISVEARNIKFHRYAKIYQEDPEMTGKFRLVKCQDCGVVYTNPRFTEGQLEKVYNGPRPIGGNWQNFPYLFQTSKQDDLQQGQSASLKLNKDDRRKLEVISSYLKGKTGARLLDIGCGIGSFVYQARQQGMEAFGIDLSKERVEYGKQTFGFGDDVLKAGQLKDHQFDHKFDVITMFDLIEHIPSPKDLLKELHALCHPDTYIVMLTMSRDSLTYKIFGKWWNYNNPTQHLVYFDNASMKRCLKETGFEFKGYHLDYTHSLPLYKLPLRFLAGIGNTFFFQVFRKGGYFRFLSPLFAGLASIPSSRMEKRIENLYPGIYVGRFKDNYLYVAQPKK